MVKALQLRLSTDLELLNDWKKDDTIHRSDEFYKDYRTIMEELMQQQRSLLLSLNKKDNINDDVVRQQMDLLDLEEEKMNQRLSFDEID